MHWFNQMAQAQRGEVHNGVARGKPQAATSKPLSPRGSRHGRKVQFSSAGTDALAPRRA